MALWDRKQQSCRVLLRCPVENEEDDGDSLEEDDVKHFFFEVALAFVLHMLLLLDVAAIASMIVLA